MKINPTVIGLFIIGGLVLVIVAVLGLGGSALFERRERAVAYFRGSVQGLSVGARVEFRGVPVGKVDAIKLEIDVRDLSAVIPVFFDYDPHSWSYIGGPARRQVNVAEAVANGLRAELVPQSFVTGQMLVELDMLPGTPAELFHPENAAIPEIPTIKSDIEQLKDVLTSLPLREIATSLNKTAHSLDRLLESPELVEILKDLRTTTSNAAALTGNLDADRVKLMADLHAAIAAIEKAGVGLQGVEADARQSLKTIDQVAGADLRKTLRTAELALQQLHTTFSEAATMLAPQSPDREQISRILDNALYALQSVRRLADDIQHKPNALLFGR